MEIASLGFRTDVMLRALEGSEVTDHSAYPAVRSPANPAFWWGNFLLLPAPAARGQADQWLALFSAEFPDAAHVALGFDVTGGDGTDLAGFTAAGLEIQRDTVLTARALRDPPHPNRDASIRQLAAMSGPIPRRAAGDWPERWSATPAGTPSIISAPRLWSSSLTRRKEPSASTVQRDSVTAKARSASSERQPAPDHPGGGGRLRSAGGA